MLDQNNQKGAAHNTNQPDAATMVVATRVLSFLEFFHPVAVLVGVFGDAREDMMFCRTQFFFERYVFILLERYTVERILSCRTGMPDVQNSFGW